IPPVPHATPATQQYSYSQPQDTGATGESEAIGDKPSRKKTSQRKTPSKPQKEELVLTAEEQAVWEEWRKAPWHGGALPTHEKNDAEHLHKLSIYRETAYPPTMENLK